MTKKIDKFNTFSDYVLSLNAFRDSIRETIISSQLENETVWKAARFARTRFRWCIV